MNRSVVSLLETVLGESHKTSGDNYSFYCPFCNHYKKKLEVNIKTQKWRCWICEDKRGRKLYRLLKLVKAPKEVVDQILTHYKDNFYEELSSEVIIPTLPKEAKPLWNVSKKNIEAKHALSYLRNRNIGDSLIRKYRIHFCDYGFYSRRIIIPSYDEKGNLNYFISRAYKPNSYSYLNPPISKNIVMMEIFINWDEDIHLVEGVFDAIAVGENTIPLLGKVLNGRLKDKLISSKCKNVYVILDHDAQKEALAICKYIFFIGKTPHLIHLSESDPSEMGYNKMQNLIKSTPPLKEQDFMKSHINSLW